MRVFKPALTPLHRLIASGAATAAQIKQIPPPRSLSGLPLEFTDGLSYKTIIKFAEPFGRRHGSAHC
jgi:hypothetical protein